jgi:hypothetical protein
MLVKATRLGYYNERRQQEGTVFKLVDKKKVVFEEKVVKGKKEKIKKVLTIPAKDQFSDKWMEKVDESDLQQNQVDFADAVADEAKSLADADVI